MIPIPVKFFKYRPVPAPLNPSMEKVEYEGHLVHFGLDCDNEGNTWSTGIVVLKSGQFVNIPVENMSLKEPFAEEDWPG